MADKRVHFNRVQQRALAVMSRVMAVVCGRGMGKSQYITGMWLLFNMLRMPRSGGGLLVPSYTGLSKITSKIYEGWEMMGYREWNPATGGHYVINKRPPTVWPMGKNAPKENFKNYVSFYNGSGFYYLSAKSAHNGADMDFLGVEEAKMVKGEKYRETALAVRGNESVFGHMACHGSRLIVTDMPRTDEGDEDWFMEWEEEHDNAAVEHILACQKHLRRLKQELKDEQRKTYAKQLERKIEQLKMAMEEIRKQTTCFIMADSLENIMALGFDYFLNMAKDLDSADLLTSVLNKPLRKVKGGFYALFSEARHGYRPPESEGFTDARKDLDVRKDLPLDIACDYNNAICCMYVGQLVASDYKILNEIIVETPSFITDLARAFLRYYADHDRKVVNYHYDPTALQGRNALSNQRYFEEFTSVLYAGKWTVNMVYHRKPTLHNDRYKFWHKMFRGAFPVNFRYNAVNCQFLPISLGNAKTKMHTDGSIGKDKRPELNKKLDQKTTTHLSEALDALVCGRFYNELESSSSSFVDVQ